MPPWSISHSPSPDELRKLYEDGFPGAPCDLANVERLFASGWLSNFLDVAPHLVGTGRGKRAYLWRSREKFDPGAFGQESQTTGDCTSHGDRNARDVTRAVEIHIKGEPERYYARGATEPTYGYRGHSGQGMDPARAAEFVTRWGFMVRKNYPGLVDLTRYNSRTGASWGGRGVPNNIKGKCEEHSVGHYTRPRTADEAMDLLFNGYACHSGQNVGFRSTADSKGIHQRSGSWNHDMATVGYDDTKTIWSERVYFVANSWGKWNSQWTRWPTDQLGSPITGLITCDAATWERYFLGGQSIFFYSDVEGFPSKTLPDYGTTSFL